MKRAIIALALLIYCPYTGSSQVLPVPLVAQEQDQWCWAGCSKCVLNYYGDSVTQCTIAEYARSVITWMSFGTTNCCINAHAGCNNPNYEATYSGSIQDILHHFYNISSTQHAYALSKTDIAAMLASNDLFIEHWTWHAGGGHFVVGYGISGSDIYYMNPWPGEGMSISTYTSMVDDGSHNWDFTLSITHPDNVVTPVADTRQPVIYPNPSTGTVSVSNPYSTSITITIYNTTGIVVFEQSVPGNSTGTYYLSYLPKGMYIVKTNSRDKPGYSKLMIQ